MNMKKTITNQGRALEDYPSDVLALQACAHFGIPVGAGFYESVLERYPEFFPRETEYRRRMKLVPQHVHDAYLKEMGEVFNERNNHPYAGLGILGRFNNPEKAAEYDAWIESKHDEWAEKEKAIWEKYYKPFGLEKTW